MNTTITQTYMDRRGTTVALVKDGLGYWHWVAIQSDWHVGNYMRHPSWTRRMAMRAACRALRLHGTKRKPRDFTRTS